MCHHHQPITVDILNKHTPVLLPNIISVESTKGRKNCPWNVRTVSGQRISVKIKDFWEPRVTDSPGCKLYAKITDIGNHGSSKTITSCSTGGKKRVAVEIYRSHSKEIQIDMSHPMKTNISFFFELTGLFCFY